MTMRVELTPVRDLPPRTIDAWHELAARAAEPNPWFEPQLIRPIAQHLVSDLMLLAAFRAEELVACLPLMRTRMHWKRVGVPAWIVPHPCGTPLVDGLHAEDALRAMVDCLTRRGPEILLSWNGIAADGVAMAALDRTVAVSRRQMMNEGSWPFLRRRAEPTYLDAVLVGKRRRNLQRSRRLLQDRLDEPVRLVDHAGEPGVVDRFLALEASGYKGRGGTAILSDPHKPDYFRDVCAGFAAHGRLRILALEAGDTTLAMKCQMCAGDGVFELKVGFDERFATFSPGVLLEIDAVSWFHDGPYKWAVTNTLHAQSPLHWLWPDQQPFSSMDMRLGRAWRALKVLA